MVYGELSGDMDHINGDRRDNRLSNLRVVTNSENRKNSKLQVNNTSGVPGVAWDKGRGKWAAYIKVNSKRVALGRFSCFWRAVIARRNAEVYFGFHINHGKHFRS